MSVRKNKLKVSAWKHKIKCNYKEIASHLKIFIKNWVYCALEKIENMLIFFLYFCGLLI